MISVVRDARSRELSQGEENFAVKLILNINKFFFFKEKFEKNCKAFFFKLTGSLIKKSKTLGVRPEDMKLPPVIDFACGMYKRHAGCFIWIKSILTWLELLEALIVLTNIN